MKIAMAATKMANKGESTLNNNDEEDKGNNMIKPILPCRHHQEPQGECGVFAAKSQGATVGECNGQFCSL